ncbi:hypothetical protein [Streptomyces sp. NPDC001089]
MRPANSSMVPDAYGLQVRGLRAWWRWENPVPQGSGVRPDGEVLLDAVAQA